MLPLDGRYNIVRHGILRRTASTRPRRTARVDLRSERRGSVEVWPSGRAHVHTEKEFEPADQESVSRTAQRSTRRVATAVLDMNVDPTEILERSLDCWSFWLLVSTFAVVLGLVLEYWHEIRDLLEKRPFKLKQFVKTLGAILVVLGVAGELFTQLGASRVEDSLRTANHKTIAELNEKASTANFRAVEAERQTAELLAEIQPRDLTIAQQKAIGDALRGFSGRFVLIRTYSLDQESGRLGMLIQAALRYGGIEVQFSPTPAPGFANLPVGLKIDGSEKRFVDGLRRVLSTEGGLGLADPNWKPEFSGTFQGVQIPRADQADIFVGVKPVKLITLK